MWTALSTLSPFVNTLAIVAFAIIACTAVASSWRSSWRSSLSDSSPYLVHSLSSETLFYPLSCQYSRSCSSLCAGRGLPGVQVPQSLASDPATWPALDDAEAEDSRALPCGHRKTPCCDAPDCVACGAPGGSPPSKEGAPCLSREREPALASLAGSAGLRSAGSPVKGVKRGSTAGVVYPGEAPASSHQKIPMSKHVRRLVTAGGAVAVPGLKLTAGAQAVHRGQTVRHHPLGDYRQGDTSASPPQGPPLGEGSPEAHQRCTKRPRPMTSLRFPEHAGGRLEASSPPVYPRGTYLSPSYDPGSTSAARSEYDLRVQNLKSRTGLKGILKWGSSPLVPETSAQVGPQEHPGCTPEGKRKLHELWPSSVHSNDGDSNSAGGRTDMDSCGAANGSGGKGSEAGAGREGGAPERGRSEGVLATEGRERGVPLLVRAAGEGYGAASGVPAGLGANRVMEDREGDGELASFRAKLQVSLGCTSPPPTPMVRMLRSYRHRIELTCTVRYFHRRNG